MKRFISTGGLPFPLMLILFACSEDAPDQITNPDVGKVPLNTVTCLGCHSSVTELPTLLTDLGISIPTGRAENGRPDTAGCGPSPPRGEYEPVP